MLIERTWEDHFLESVLIGDGCWGWTAAHNTEGYGLWQPPGASWNARKKDRVKRSMAHKIMWEILCGPVPDGLELDHLCKFKGCVNPDHLEPVTHMENLRRSHIFCKQGHRLEVTRRVWACGVSRCGVCYDGKLAAKRAARLARGLKKPGRRKSSD